MKNLPKMPQDDFGPIETAVGAFDSIPGNVSKLPGVFAGGLVCRKSNFWNGGAR